MKNSTPILRPMAIRPECRGCLERLLALAVDLATPDSALRQQAHQAACQVLDQEFGPAAIPALIANRMLHQIHQISGNPDPFAARKTVATASAARVQRLLTPAREGDLDSLIRLAAAGNALDFFRDTEETAREMQAAVVFGISHLPEFCQELAGPPGLLLYLADNAGEQFFDRPLVDFLRRQGWQVIYVVKGGPIQNDLTLDDLAASGLQEALEPVVDTGAQTVGLEIAATSAEFQKLYNAARLILAKGMGHFETMSHLDDPRLWFLLQAKCGPVARSLGVEKNTFAFLRTLAISLDTDGKTE